MSLIRLKMKENLNIVVYYGNMISSFCFTSFALMRFMFWASIYLWCMSLGFLQTLFHPSELSSFSLTSHSIRMCMSQVYAQLVQLNFYFFFNFFVHKVFLTWVLYYLFVSLLKRYYPALACKRTVNFFFLISIFFFWC